MFVQAGVAGVVRGRRRRLLPMSSFGGQVAEVVPGLKEPDGQLLRNCRSSSLMLLLNGAVLTARRTTVNQSPRTGLRLVPPPTTSWLG